MLVSSVLWGVELVTGRDSFWQDETHRKLCHNVIYFFKLYVQSAVFTEIFTIIFYYDDEYSIHDIGHNIVAYY